MPTRINGDNITIPGSCYLTAWVSSPDTVAIIGPGGEVRAASVSLANLELLNTVSQNPTPLSLVQRTSAGNVLGTGMSFVQTGDNNFNIPVGDELSIVGDGIGSMTIPAGKLQVGDCIRIVFDAAVTCSGTGPGTFRVAVTVGLGSFYSWAFTAIALANSTVLFRGVFEAYVKDDETIFGTLDEGFASTSFIRADENSFYINYENGADDLAFVETRRVWMQIIHPSV